jgi:hypothetical protein
VSKAPVRGLFWFDDKDSDGFVALQNVSDQHISLTPRFQVTGTTYSLPTVDLAPNQGLKLDLRKELRHLGLDEATAGGIELAYEGPSDSVKAHGVLFDRKGFSAELDFTRYEEMEEKQTLSLRTPRFAIGTADPELGLPAKTTFDPVAALHNFHDTPLDVNLAVGFPDGQTTKQVNIPLTIPPGDTRVVHLHQYLKDALPEGTSWASLEVS